MHRCIFLARVLVITCASTLACVARAPRSDGESAVHRDTILPDESKLPTAEQAVRSQQTAVDSATPLHAITRSAADSVLLADSLARMDAAARDSVRRYTADSTWRTFRAPVWGLVLRHPRSFTFTAVGPKRAACDDSAKAFDDLRDSVVLRSVRGPRSGTRGTMRLRFVRLPFDSLLEAYGFAHDDDGWHTVGRQGMQDEAQHASTPTWDLIEGSAIVGVDAEGGGMALSDDYRMLVVFKRADGCSAVISYYPALAPDGVVSEVRQYEDFRRTIATMRFTLPNAP
jgi:hypothetical protein